MIKVNNYYIYSFKKDKDHNNKSKALVRVNKILPDERGIANVSFIKVFKDDTGNNFFTYLRKSGNTMNVSIKYLRRCYFWRWFI